MINPDEAVAYGAAVQAAILSGDTCSNVNMKVRQSTSHHMHHVRISRLILNNHKMNCLHQKENVITMGIVIKYKAMQVIRFCHPSFLSVHSITLFPLFCSLFMMRRTETAKAKADLGLVT